MTLTKNQWRKIRERLFIWPLAWAMMAVVFGGFFFITSNMSIWVFVAIVYGPLLLGLLGSWIIVKKKL